jgi:uncharacterized integral membrane protein
MDENGFRDVEEGLEPEQRQRRADRDGVPWGALLLIVWAVVLIVFAVQNADDTPVEFLAWETQMPVALLVLITALATLVLTGLGSAVYRRRRRQRRDMKEAPRSED